MKYQPRPLLDMPCTLKFSVKADLIDSTRAIFNPDERFIEISPAMAQVLFSGDPRTREKARKSLEVIDLTAAKTLLNY